jgi:predicted 3-demethylubiquinone-9 3-methyltransferase (glyoxalase superfamily)
LLAGGRQPEATNALEGQAFIALNGGPDNKFNPSISLVANGNDYPEVICYKEKISEGDEEGFYFRLMDMFSVYWRVVRVSPGKMMISTRLGKRRMSRVPCSRKRIYLPPPAIYLYRGLMRSTTFEFDRQPTTN